MAAWPVSPSQHHWPSEAELEMPSASHRRLALTPSTHSPHLMTRGRLLSSPLLQSPVSPTQSSVWRRENNLRRSQLKAECEVRERERERERRCPWLVLVTLPPSYYLLDGGLVRPRGGHSLPEDTEDSDCNYRKY